MRVIHVELVAFSLLFGPRSLKKALAALAVERTVYAAKRNGNHNNENLFDLFARQCALCREHLQKMVARVSSVEAKA